MLPEELAQFKVFPVGLLADSSERISLPTRLLLAIESEGKSL